MVILPYNYNLPLSFTVQDYAIPIQRTRSTPNWLARLLSRWSPVQSTA